MSGLVNTKGVKHLGNKLLKDAERKVEGQLTPENRENYMKIVVAGQRAGLQGGPNSLLASLQDSADPIADAAKGAVALVLVLRQEAKGVMPFEAMIPAAMTLMLMALDFADRSRIAKIGTPELVKATHVFTDEVFRVFEMTKKNLANMGKRVYDLTKDPLAMEKINLKAGVTKHSSG